MGFVEHNSFGKFEAEVNLPMPSFSAESLLSLSGRQFAAATVDAANVTNYDPDSWSRFQLGEQSKIFNDGGLIKTQADQGWHFTNDADALTNQIVKIYDKNKANAVTFTLAPGDQLTRGGQWSTAVQIPAGGTADLHGIVTKIPWMHGWKATEDPDGSKFSHAGDGSRHTYYIGVEPSTTWVDPAGGNGDNGTNGDSTCATENRAANTDGTCGDCLSGFTEDDTGTCVADVAEEEETNWLLYGGAFALLAVGGVMAMKMMKKSKK